MATGPPWQRINQLWPFGRRAKDPSTLSPPGLEEEKEWCLREIKYWEEYKANYQTQLDTWSPTNTHGVTREYLVWEVQYYESLIQPYQDHLTACQTRLLEFKEAEAQAKEADALANSDTRAHFTQSTKQNCVASKTLSGTMSGFAGSGKSHTLAMVTREKPPSLRVSTPVTTLPTRTITQTRIGVEGTTLKKMTDEQFTDSFVVSAKASVARATTGVSFKIISGILNLISKPPEPTNAVERELIVKFGTLDESAKSLKDQVVVEISDCGGQPQFLEILPRFIESIDFSILVTNLSQRFDQYPINYFFNEEGKPVGEGVQSPLSNEQVIRLHLQMIASLTQGGRRPVMAVVGTHRDLEGMCTHEEGKCEHGGECFQSREEKNQRLKEMIESFGLKDSMIFFTHNELIFAVNAKTPEEEDYQTIDHLMDSILKKCPPRIDHIPLSYHALELALKRKAHDSGHLAFSESALLKEMSTYNFSKMSFKEALRYLHKKRRAIYYEKVFPGRVLGEPQAILNKQTELVVYNIQLATNTKKQTTEEWRFVKYGFFNINHLKRFPDHYVEGVFTPEDMLKLFVKLLMVSEVRDGEYLMPCVLPTDPLANCNPEPDTQSVPPMVLHFPGGPTRYGVFCGTVCHVMTKSKWELLMEPIGSDQPYHITRNSVHFCLPDYLGKVTLNDPFNSFFVVTVHVPVEVSPYSEVVSHMCMEVRDTLLDAIAKVTAKLNYSAAPPTVAFLCTEHEDVHPAIMAARGDTLLCTHTRNTNGGCLTAGHRVWLRDSSSTKPYPDLTPKESATANQLTTNSSTTSQPSDPQPAPSSPQASTSASTNEPSTSYPDPCKKPATTIPPSIGGKPTLGQLVLLKVGDKHKRITTELGVDWDTLALLLDFDPGEIKAIKDDNRGLNEKSCRDMFRRWLDGGACQPVTWGKLVKAIRDIPNCPLAREIEELLLH